MSSINIKPNYNASEFMSRAQLNALVAAQLGTQVGRDPVTGDAASGQDLGSSSHPFGTLYCEGIRFGDSIVNINEVLTRLLDGLSYGQGLVKSSVVYPNDAPASYIKGEALEIIIPSQARGAMVSLSHITRQSLQSFTTSSNNENPFTNYNYSSAITIGGVFNYLHYWLPYDSEVQYKIKLYDKYTRTGGGVRSGGSNGFLTQNLIEISRADLLADNNVLASVSTSVNDPYLSTVGYKSSGQVPMTVTRGDSPINPIINNAAPASFNDVYTIHPKHPNLSKVIISCY